MGVQLPLPPLQLLRPPRTSVLSETILSSKCQKWMTLAGSCLNSKRTHGQGLGR